MFLSLMPSLFTSMILLLTNHPLAMTLTILIQTLLICLSLSTITQTFWFSYILFLVFLGGMLVLFIYITSLASNEMFSSFLWPISLLLIFMTLIFMLTMFIDLPLFNSSTHSADMYTMTSTNFPYNESNYLLTKLYNIPTHLITIMLVSYLFLTLIAIVKITNIYLGPLRQKY
uniref:NADH-ubiquinone oxidoreductase chain 6 n=1 Tax=Holochlora fruhstorferi TaxID=1945530 RepID=A0A1Q1MPT8_9ORTH|nr:NADH dehydrogenase subunit 6 [Holochlora fruhstorferi]AQM40093.1 NADH dehydrogenase subunit 6 [Holochlora fruhstorferi]